MHFRASTKKGWKRLDKQYKCSQQDSDLLLENFHVNKQVYLAWVCCRVATGISTVTLYSLSEGNFKKKGRSIILIPCGDMIQRQLPVLWQLHTDTRSSMALSHSTLLSLTRSLVMHSATVGIHVTCVNLGSLILSSYFEVEQLHRYFFPGAWEDLHRGLLSIL